jgi:hypothetical protein
MCVLGVKGRVCGWEKLIMTVLVVMRMILLLLLTMPPLPQPILNDR